MRPKSADESDLNQRVAFPLIAIMSDSHDNLPNLKKSLAWCKKHQVKKIIFCGDVTTASTLSCLSVNFRGEIFLIKGNADLFSDKQATALPNIRFLGEIGIIDLEGIRIGLCHEPRKIKRTISLSPTPLRWIFYGHTHTPWLEKSGSTTLINPGNLAGIFHQASFAVMDMENSKLDLKILADL